MKRFLVDLHVHSRFSRATSSRLTVNNLAAWSAIKGLQVMATGDFTHPEWRAELRRDLIRDESTGLYRPRQAPVLAQEAPDLGLPEGFGGEQGPLFMLQAEISSIYKKDGAVRKIHNLVFMPDFEGAERLCRKLEVVGNLASDGRPILGLDARRLLEMVLEADERAVLIPAHIWTPWFSLFGSKSGFDSVEACFGDLSSHVFAMETGLSSDPDMNRLWSHLDRFVMVSNSDAHSGENLGREANVFRGTPSYEGLFSALRRAARLQVQGATEDRARSGDTRSGDTRSGDTRSGDTRSGDARVEEDPFFASSTEALPCHYEGTLEFFPEEGKYHLDGHRACNVVLEPHETRQLHNLCPVCGKPVTVGVLSRVMALADRQSPVPETGTGFASLVPLPELLGELLHVGPKSRKVQTRYGELLRYFGSEMDILHQVPEGDLRHHWDDLGEAVARMRSGQVIRHGGYDGEYGLVRMFADGERPGTNRRQASLLQRRENLMPVVPIEPLVQGHAGDLAQAIHGVQEPAPVVAPFVYTPDQQHALEAGPQPVLVLAGPGSGKTRTLVARMVRLIETGTAVENVVAVTFTRRAAAELRERLALALSPSLQTPSLQTPSLQTPSLQTPSLQTPSQAALPTADTLHALALAQWQNPSKKARAKEERLEEGVIEEQSKEEQSTEEHIAERPIVGGQPAILSEDAAKAAFAAANAGSPVPVHSEQGEPGSGECGSKEREAGVREAWNALALSREMLQPPAPQFVPLLERYTAYKTKRGLADYTDLLEHWLHRLTSHKKVDSKADNESRINSEQTDTSTTPGLWEHVLVDEIQDLSPLQLALVQALLPDDGKGFFGIGDPDQSIYGFRGAQPKVHEALKRAWPTLTTVTLRQSHRSARGILDSAASLLGAASACGPLESTLPVEARLQLFEAPDGAREASWIAEQAFRLMGGTSHTLADANDARQTSQTSQASKASKAFMPQGQTHLQSSAPLVHSTQSDFLSLCSPGDMAVLVRLKAQIAPLRQALEKRGIPCAVPEASPFWAEPRVALLLALAGRKLGRPAPLPVPDPSSIGAAVWERGPRGLLAHLEATPPFDVLFGQSREFAALVAAYNEQGNWLNLLDWVQLRQDLDLVRSQCEQVQIMTMHASKGLEFKAVFLPGLEQGLLPFMGMPALLGQGLPQVQGQSSPVLTNEQKQSQIQAQIDEERRLFYVGLTRAAEAVFISYAQRRILYGHEVRLPVSSFLEQLPNLFQRTRLVRHTRKTSEQMRLL